MAQGGSGAEEDFSRPQDVAIRLHRTIRALAKAFCLKELFHGAWRIGLSSNMAIFALHDHVDADARASGPSPVVGREERDLTQGQKRYFGLFIVRPPSHPPCL